MRLFFAGLAAGHTTEELKELGITNKLYSYHNEQNLSKEWGTDGLMLDSGAFTAWTKGISINMEELISFIEKIRPEFAIQLDVIGDEEATWKNYKKMMKKVNVLPVIHYMASEKHIKRVFEHDYVCLGGLVPYAKKKKELKAWLDYIYSFKKAHEKRIHCLGITTQNILQKYPFYSADSTAWISATRHRTVASFEQGKLIYYESMNKKTAVPKLGNFRVTDIETKDLIGMSARAFLDMEKFINKIWQQRKK